MTSSSVQIAVILALSFFPMTRMQAADREQTTMAPFARYQMNRTEEQMLARTAAPSSISDGATVMVLGRDGYRTAFEGRNGFVCLVERSWGASSDDPEFWNPRVRAPICFNPSAARSYLPIYLFKTKLILQGKSHINFGHTIATAMQKGQLPTLEPGAMCYMMSKQQYLGDRDMSWHPHLMFFVRGDEAKNWGANLPGSPIMAANDPEEGVTIFLVLVGKWSDETPAPATH